MKIYRYSNEPEARKVKVLLENQNIPCEIRSFENWGYDGLFRGQMGMGEIIVPDEFTEKAKVIVDKFVKEERNKPVEMDAGLASIVLKQNVGNLNALIYVIFIAFVIFGSFLLLRMRSSVGISIFVLLTVGVVLAIKRTKKILRDTKKALERAEKKQNEETISS